MAYFSCYMKSVFLIVVGSILMNNIPSTRGYDHYLDNGRGMKSLYYKFMQIVILELRLKWGSEIIYYVTLQEVNILDDKPIEVSIILLNTIIMITPTTRMMLNLGAH